MKSICKYGLIVFCGMIATASLLGFVLVVGLGVEFASFVQKMNSQTVLYIFPALIFLEFCFLTNDLLVYLSRTFHLNFGLQFSEARFTYENDNSDAPIPLKTKLLQLYPLSIGLVTLGFTPFFVG